MQRKAPIDSSETDSKPDAAEARPAIPDMIPLTQSKMHVTPEPAPEQPALPRRSALVIEILSFVLIAFVAVSALLFNFAGPGRLIPAPSGVTVQLPPRPVEPTAALPAADSIVREERPAEAPPPGTAALPDLQPRAGSEPAPRAEPPTEIATLPRATEPVVPDASTSVASEAVPAPPPSSAEETASLALDTQATEALIRRGDELLSTGDIAAARSAYERAAVDGNRVAARGVAKTYDPAFLTQSGVRGLRGDPARAALWYGKAAAAGDHEAQQRLRRLRAQSPQ